MDKCKEFNRENVLAVLKESAGKKFTCGMIAKMFSVRTVEAREVMTELLQRNQLKVIAGHTAHYFVEKAASTLIIAAPRRAYHPKRAWTAPKQMTERLNPNRRSPITMCSNVIGINRIEYA